MNPSAGWATTSVFSSSSPAPHGKFDIRIDGELVAEHRHEPNAHLFPDLQDLLKAIEERVPKKAPA